MSTSSKVKLSEKDYLNLSHFIFTTIHFLLYLAEIKKTPLSAASNKPIKNEYNKYITDISSSFEKHEVKFVNDLFQAYQNYCHTKNSKFIGTHIYERSILREIYDEVYDVYSIKKTQLTDDNIKTMLHKKLEPIFIKNGFPVSYIDKLNISKELVKSNLKGNKTLSGAQQYTLRGLKFLIGAEPRLFKTIGHEKKTLEKYLQHKNFDDDSFNSYQINMNTQAKTLLSICKNVFEVKKNLHVLLQKVVYFEAASNMGPDTF